ncbi:unnamed protein product [Echinostoma caproni]|uniref:RNase III domain-containing protein n=1 Tax=Echinostoma caproni TaxID=27848 RepID=A0A183B3G1_9TREM|nr:unnamed protein product [Echinostoma caproni]
MKSNFDATLPLAMCFRLTRHQNAAQVAAGSRKDKHDVDDKLSLYLADTCAVHPLSAWLWFLLSTVPLVLYQLSRGLMAAQFSTELTQILIKQDSENVDDENRIAPGTLIQCTIIMPDRLDSPHCMLSHQSHFTPIDLKVDRHTSAEWCRSDELAMCDLTASSRLAPNPYHLLEATTLLGAHDAVNLERLELLGDSLLQLIGTLDVYSSASVDANEGWLTDQRISLVSNANLSRLAVKFGWAKYCTGHVYSPPSHFVFPCYTVCTTASLPDGDARLTVGLTDKSLADMMEALIGCFLIHLGLPSAVRLLSHFGISPFGTNESQTKGMWRRLLCTDGFTTVNSPVKLGTSDTNEAKRLSRPISMPFLGDNSIPNSPILTERDNFIKPEQLTGLQNIIGYYFTDVTLLIQALVHISSPHVKRYGSYERFEFLGDAVLGYLITVYLYHEHVEFDPGQLTESRSNIVSNKSLASAVVEHKIHPYIIHSNPCVESAVSCITCIHDRTSSYSEQLELLNQEVLKGLRLKVLADVFESIIGAIFVDSQGDLDLVNRVIHRLLIERIRKFAHLASFHLFVSH